MSIAARRVARLLRATGDKVVFAESCTGGLLSGELTKVPGISDFHCGGVVVYRNATKIQYLDVSPRLLESKGAVSPEVASQMARQVLRRTPEATLAVSVTGHLGPQAPPELDGRVFVGIARDRNKAPEIYPLDCRRQRGRIARQRWVVERALALIEQVLRPRAAKAARTAPAGGDS